MKEKEFFLQEAVAGKIFVYPTDTIYGIGGVINHNTIEKISMAKQRQGGKHYSLIAPSFTWVEKHCDVKDFEVYRTMKKSDLPAGRGLTIVCPIKNQYKKSVGLVSSNNHAGIRFIDHVFQNFVSHLGEGFISTSCNISGKPVINKISMLSSEQIPYIDYAISGEIQGGIGSVIIEYGSNTIIRP